MTRTLIAGDHHEEQQQPARDGGTPPGESCTAHTRYHSTQRTPSAPAARGADAGGQPFEPVQTVDRGPAGLRRRHLKADAISARS